MKGMLTFWSGMALYGASAHRLNISHMVMPNAHTSLCVVSPRRAKTSGDNHLTRTLWAVEQTKKTPRDFWQSWWAHSHTLPHKQTQRFDTVNVNAPHHHFPWWPNSLKSLCRTLENSHGKHATNTVALGDGFSKRKPLLFWVSGMLCPALGM